MNYLGIVFFFCFTNFHSIYFSVFGEIKALRLPKKMTPGSNSHRGFGFVDFTTSSDAKVSGFQILF